MPQTALTWNGLLGLCSAMSANDKHRGLEGSWEAKIIKGTPGHLRGYPAESYEWCFEMELLTGCLRTTYKKTLA